MELAREIPFRKVVVRWPGMKLVASLLLVAMPGAPSSFLLLVVRPGAPSSVLAPSNKQQKTIFRERFDPHGFIQIQFALRRVEFPGMGRGDPPRVQNNQDIRAFSIILLKGLAN